MTAVAKGEQHDMNHTKSSGLTASATLEMSDSTDSTTPARVSGGKPSVGCPQTQPLTTNRNLLKWIEKMAALTQPAAIHWVDGSQKEYERLCAQMVAAGPFKSSTRNFGRGASTRSRTQATSHGWKIAPTFARSPGTMPGRPTTGSIPSKCARGSRSFSKAPCVGAQYMCWLSRWDRLARRSRRSEFNLPTRHMRWSTCGLWHALVCRSSRRSTQTPCGWLLAFTR